MQPNALEARERLLAEDFNTILDVGSGVGNHAAAFISAGKQVTTIDHVYDPDLGNEHMLGDMGGILDALKVDGRKFEAVWLSHVLEHALNPHQLLRQIFDVLEDDGMFVVTVPPLKHSVVGGHVNLFNEGLLLYRLILAGFDCSCARVGVYGYNISVIVRKKKAIMDGLYMDAGDIEKLAEFFPVPVKQGFDGQIGSVNW